MKIEKTRLGTVVFAEGEGIRGKECTLTLKVVNPATREETVLSTLTLGEHDADKIPEWTKSCHDRIVAAFKE